MSSAGEFIWKSGVKWSNSKCALVPAFSLELSGAALKGSLPFLSFQLTQRRPLAESTVSEKCNK